MNKIRLFSILSFISCTLSCLSLLAASLYDIILQNSTANTVESILSYAFWVFLIVGVAFIFVLRTLTGGKVLNFWRVTKAVDILILVFVAVYALCNLMLAKMLPAAVVSIIAVVSYTAFVYCFELHCILILNRHASQKYDG